ncbi:acetyltransferase [Idiomarina abyssalis]|uniref:acetyltransferase n=1 Tax=Idiomarina abyssalis TaxID=86102 RepID=UPI001054D43E|nr:acetyltransferase [Marinobacter sp. JH2]QBM16393.1 putative acetyltransferase EpsM [Marinobacter sp. JH2]
MKRLAVLGASGHGKVVADAAEASGWQSVVFYDDAWPELQVNGPWGVRGDTETLLGQLSEFDGVVVGIGNNALRADKQQLLFSASAGIVSIVHPAAVVSAHARIQPGAVVFANAVVNAGAEVGAGCIINTGSVVEHDCILGDFAHISPNAVLAGGVIVECQAWVGACASVRQLLRVGKAAMVGMGAVVTKDVSASAVVVGNPAKVVNS